MLKRDYNFCLFGFAILSMAGFAAACGLFFVLMGFAVYVKAQMANAELLRAQAKIMSIRLTPLPTSTPWPTFAMPTTPPTFTPVLPTATQIPTPTPYVPTPTVALPTPSSAPPTIEVLLTATSAPPTVAPTPEMPTAVPPTETPLPTQTPVIAYICDHDAYNCSDPEAQAAFAYCMAQGTGDIHRLDGDNDGQACEGNQ